MRTPTSVFIALLCTAAVKAHGDHDHESAQVIGGGGDAMPDLMEDDVIRYAELHMAQEHHFDSFDLPAFFHLHDLNRDGVLDENEIESIYGVHHEKVKKKTGNVEVHTAQAKAIVKTVLEKLDKNGDGLITMREFNEGGVAGLPNFKNVEHLGHHYDAEGEYFLHHEEKYHSSPDTQNEEDYIHPEDIEHFMQHEEIEAKEERKVKEFMGESLPDEIPQDAEAAAAVAAAVAATEEQQVLRSQNSRSNPGGRYEPGLTSEEAARQERAEFAKAQAAKFGKASADAAKRGEWDGLKKPKDTIDRLRKGVPYKFKVRKSFWDF